MAAKTQATLEYDRKRGKHIYKAPKTNKATRLQIQGCASNVSRFSGSPKSRVQKGPECGCAYETARRKCDARIVDDEPSNKHFWWDSLFF